MYLEKKVDFYSFILSDKLAIIVKTNVLLNSLIVKEDGSFLDKFVKKYLWTFAVWFLETRSDLLVPTSGEVEAGDWSFGLQ